MTTTNPVEAAGVAPHGCRLAVLSAGHDKRRLCETVTGIKRLATKTHPGERLLETIKGGCPHRFGPEECEVPTRQIQAFKALVAVAFYGGDAHFIGEVRPATGVGAVARDFL